MNKKEKKKIYRNYIRIKCCNRRFIDIIYQLLLAMIAMTGCLHRIYYLFIINNLFTDIKFIYLQQFFDHKTRQLQSDFPLSMFDAVVAVFLALQFSRMV